MRIVRLTKIGQLQCRERAQHAGDHDQGHEDRRAVPAKQVAASNRRQNESDRAPHTNATEIGSVPPRHPKRGSVGNRVVSAAADHTMREWDIVSGRCIAVYQLGVIERVNVIAYSEHGLVSACVADLRAMMIAGAGWSRQ